MVELYLLTNSMLALSLEFNSKHCCLSVQPQALIILTYHNQFYLFFCCSETSSVTELERISNIIDDLL